ncbi:MAG: hypothetical protein CVV59_00935 [Tenericutes bacterium HGW-Tenericutes-4]|jgi:hypothetical protein|nr:MAG: hypothetical protein CVV59_00935 [Tenericutes bacterium HGW-Tenericutes-4]
MQKIIIHLGELKQNVNSMEKNRGVTSLYHFLLFKMLNLKIKNNYLLIKPNYERINFSLEVHFTYKDAPYSFLIDGKNKVIIANDIRLCNIQKISLEFLKQQKSVM